MNDKELAKTMRLIAECERRSGTAQPKTIDLLEQGAARLDALRWRSVEDGEMPTTTDPIDVWDIEDKEVIVGWYEDGEFRATHGDAYLVIVATHWRPRPAPGEVER